MSMVTARAEVKDKNIIEITWTMVVAHLAEQWLLTPVAKGLNPAISSL